MSDEVKKKFEFFTAIITYPSDYDGMLPLGYIVDKMEEVKTATTKIVVAREDPDDKIQRIHYHVYWDDETRKKVKEKYFDIELKQPVVVFIRHDKSRYYIPYGQLAAQLGIDNLQEMPAKIDQHVSDLNEEITLEELKANKMIVRWDYLTHAHANIETKKVYGDKYFMLKYVVKQKLIARSNFDVDEELKYLEENCQQLLKKVQLLIGEKFMQEIQITTIDELIELLKRYKQKMDKKAKEKKAKRKYNKKTKEQLDMERAFCELIRNIFYENPGITKREVMDIVNGDENYYFVYASKYLNYNKLINDSFKNKPNAKINRDYELKWWVPNKLYDYLEWLANEWVPKWMTGREQCERRPKGLVLIGESRTGKSSLMALCGDYVYFKNIWNSDNWEYLPAYTIMDDMDAADEGKGLSFSWFKPWFGAQDSITITDKYRPKEDINNGKPLIWLNNFDIEETFKSEAAQRYIRKNMIYINIGNRPLFIKPEGMDIYKYREWNPKTTWYYKNVICKKDKGKNPDASENDDIKEDQEANNGKKWVFIDETQKTVERCTTTAAAANTASSSSDTDSEKGRPNKRVRTKDSGNPGMD